MPTNYFKEKFEKRVKDLQNKVKGKEDQEKDRQRRNSSRKVFKILKLVKILNIKISKLFHQRLRPSANVELCPDCSHIGGFYELL